MAARLNVSHLCVKLVSRFLQLLHPPLLCFDHQLRPLVGTRHLLTDTRYEPKFCVDTSDEHTPINIPESDKNFPHDYEATMVATTEEPDVLRHSGASSSSKHTTAASKVSTVPKLGSLGNSFCKKVADYESVDSRNSIRETCADPDRETVVSISCRSELKGKRDRDQNEVQSFNDSENLQKIIELKADRRRRENQQNCMKQRQPNTGKRKIRTLLFMRSIRNLNPNDCNRRINGLNRPKERR